jgi:hypothetical protein
MQDKPMGSLHYITTMRRNSKPSGEFLALSPGQGKPGGMRMVQKSSSIAFAIEELFGFDFFRGSEKFAQVG